jgi:hypothetical protein
MHVLYVNGADALIVDRWIHSGTRLGLDRKRLSLKRGQADSAANSSSRAASSSSLR